MSRALHYIFSLLIVVTASSCRFFETGTPENIIARVNDHTLTQSDLDKIIASTVVIDTASFTQNYINNWATDQLLLDGALRNISPEEKDRFDNLVSNYRNDLYTRYYKDALINKQLDSIVSDVEALDFYNDNKANFLLNEPLIQFKFIQVDPDYQDVNTLKSFFIGNTEQDRYALDSLKFQYRDFFLNDSIWVKQPAVVDQINPINSENANKLLKKTNFLQLRDSLGLYLIAIKNTLERNDNAPLDYIRPTINQIINNKRKLALIKRLEKEIKDDAIKNKQFEIYID